MRPGFDNFLEDIVQRLGNGQLGIMLFHLVKVADVANVVAFSILVNIFPLHWLSCQSFDGLEGFQDRARILAASPAIVDFGDSRGFDEFFGEPGDIAGMNVIPNLLAFVSMDFVNTFGHVDLHQIA